MEDHNNWFSNGILDYFLFQIIIIINLVPSSNKLKNETFICA